MTPFNAVRDEFLAQHENEVSLTSYCQWQPEKSFVVSDNNLSHFRTLKQYIWDLYWAATNINQKTSAFRVTISQFPTRPEDAGVASRQSDSARTRDVSGSRDTASNLHNVMVVAECSPKISFPSPRSGPPPTPPPPYLPSLNRLKEPELESRALVSAGYAPANIRPLSSSRRLDATSMQMTTPSEKTGPTSSRGTSERLYKNTAESQRTTADRENLWDCARQLVGGHVLVGRNC